jgi:hypothetical protein
MLETLRYPTMVMSAVQAALEKAGTFISMISSESFKSSAAAAASGSGSGSGSGSAESSSSNSKKKAKSDSSAASTGAPSSSHDTARAVSRLLESLNKLQDLITEVTQHVNEIAGDSGQAVQQSASRKHSSSLVFSALSTLGNHYLNLSHLLKQPNITVLFLDETVPLPPQCYLPVPCLVSLSLSFCQSIGLIKCILPADLILSLPLSPSPCSCTPPDAAQVRDRACSHS